MAGQPAAPYLDAVTTINVHRQGSGSPVVMVHGLGSRWEVFTPVIDLVARQHEVIAVDLPGFGGTPPLDGVAPGPRGYAAWLTDWLAAEGITRPHVVGSSMGGGIGLELGRTGVASRVTAFSPIGFYGPVGLRWTQGLLTALRLTATHAGPALDRLVGSRAGRAAALSVMFGRPTQVSAPAAKTDLAGLAGSPSFPEARDSFGGFHVRPGDDLGRLADIPVTIAWGTRDVVLVHRTQSRAARAALPHARHVDLPGCGHLPFSDDPDRCAGLILEETP